MGTSRSNEWFLIRAVMALFYFKFFDKVVDKGYFLLYNEYRNKEQGENNDYY